jgi:hypothetical protein
MMHMLFFISACLVCSDRQIKLDKLKMLSTWLKYPFEVSSNIIIAALFSEWFSANIYLDLIKLKNIIKHCKFLSANFHWLFSRVRNDINNRKQKCLVGTRFFHLIHWKASFFPSSLRIMMELFVL